MALVQGDALRLPYPDNTFDAVTSYQVLPYFPGQEEAFFTEAHRVLKLGGTFLVDPIGPVTKQSDDAFSKLVRAMSRTLLRRSPVKSWSRRPTSIYFLGALTDAGFDARTFQRHYSKDWQFLVDIK